LVEVALYAELNAVRIGLVAQNVFRVIYVLAWGRWMQCWLIPESMYWQDLSTPYVRYFTSR
jgi:hypothetical protein